MSGNKMGDFLPIRLKILSFILIGLVLAALPLGLALGQGNKATVRLSLDQAVEAALKAHPSLDAAAAQVERAELQLSVVKDTYDEAVRRERNGGSGPTFGVDPYDLKDASISFNNASMGLKLAHTARNFARESLRGQVSRSYFETMKAEMGINSAEAAVKRAEENHRVVKAQYQAGVAARNEVLGAEAQLAMTRAGLEMAKHGRQIGLMSLKNLTGTPLKAEVELTTPLAQPEAEEMTEAEVQILIARLGDSRLDVARAEQSLLTQQVNLEILSSRYFPQSHPYKLQALNVKEAQANYRTQLMDAEVQVRQAHLKILAARDNYRALKQALEPARESLRLARIRHQAGVAALAEVISAESVFAQAETQAMQALTDYHLARLSFELAAGTQIFGTQILK